MTIIRPRLTDFHGIDISQNELDFVIPFIDEDIPLYMDPFLLWKSPSLQDQSLHTTIVNEFNRIGREFAHGDENAAINLLVGISESDEVGLGNSKTRSGLRMGKKLASDILSIYQDIESVSKYGIVHLEALQLITRGFSRDRISDISCKIIESFLIDYTIQHCEELNIPLEKVELNSLYDTRNLSLKSEKVYLPINPVTKVPIQLIPKRWLRFIPWINTDDYFKSFFKHEVDNDILQLDKVKLLNYNRQNYGLIDRYIKIKERTANMVKSDPLFTSLPITSVRKKLSSLKKLPTGKSDNADIKYEKIITQLMASFLYPHLDFAAEQCRTISGVQIRDLVFYNNVTVDFLKDIKDLYDTRQLVFEMKNVKELTREHLTQMNRYLNDNLGRFGIIVTRNRPASKILKSTIDLWSGQRKCILILDDSDIELMSIVFQSKQRMPIEVLKKKYIEFQRLCPS